MRMIDADAVLDRYYAEFKKQDICDGSQDRDWLMRCIEEAPTLTPPNEWVEALEAINNAAVAYIEGGPYENDLPGMELAVEIDRLSRDFVRPPNEPLTLEQLREMDGKPVYLVDLDFPHLSGWHIASWNDCFAATTVHSSRGDYYDSRREYGATWICYRRQPEGEED